MSARDDGIVIGFGNCIAPQVEEISRRDWFANNAPEVPHWFRFGCGKRPELPKPEDHMTTAQLQSMADLLADRITADQADPAVLRFSNLMAQAEAQLKRWEADAKMKRFCAWRFFYADQMIKAGEKP